MQQDPKCSCNSCPKNWSYLVTAISNRSVVRQDGYCKAHGIREIESYLGDHRCWVPGVAATSLDVVSCDLILTVYDYSTNQQWVYLQEEEEGRILVLSIGFFEATTMFNAVHRRSSPFGRPPTHRAMMSLISALGGDLEDIIIDRFLEREGYYAATVRIHQRERTVEVDFRPSDAICLALYCGVPILMTKAVRDKLPQRGSGEC